MSGIPWYTFNIYSQVVLKDQQIPSTSSCLDPQVVVPTTDTGHSYGNPWDCNLRSAADR